MRITIDPALFDDPSRDFHLTNLLCDAVGRPHQLLVGPDGGDRLVFDQWVGRQGLGLRAPLMALVDYGMDPEFTRAPPGVVIKVSEADAERIDAGGWRATATLRRTIDLVQMPLRIVLENGVSDRAFLRKIAPPGEFRDFLDHAETERWIEYVNGSGSMLGKLLASYDPWQRLRTWAMCDAETWLPTAITKVEHHQVVAFRRESEREPRIPLEVLERRAIENYIPITALKRWARFGKRREERQRRSEFVEALIPLDACRPPHARFALRHHYHFEEGFESDPAQIPADYDAFRSDPYLAGGIGSAIKKVWEATRDPQYGTRVDWMDDGWLAADGQRPEIQRIIASIKRRM